MKKVCFKKQKELYLKTDKLNKGIINQEDKILNISLFNQINCLRCYFYKKCKNL